MMKPESITPYSHNPLHVQRAPNTTREVLGILFRNRRVVLVSFVATFVGVVIAVVFFGIKYQAQTEILVKHQRGNNVVSTDEGQGRADSDDHAREREINTEVALLQSGDLLEQVVKECGLDSSRRHFWSGWLPAWGDSDSSTAKAVQKLQKHLQIEPLPDSNIIQARYTSHHPDEAARVLRKLDDLYIAKHVAVYRPAGASDFFKKQTRRYQEELRDAETQLASFNTEQDAPAPEMEKNLVLKQASDFDGQLQQTRASIKSTQEQIQAIKAEIAKTPSRITTQHTTAQNPQLMANLKSTLQNLEIQRTDLLSKYQPSYMPVQEIEKQISQVKQTIAITEKAPMHQDTTDQNQTYQMLQSDLAQAKAKLAALRAQATAMAPVVHTYSRQAILLDQKQIKQQDLLRNVKTAEQNYLLYLNKSQQAQISDALDRQRILNVSVAESAAVPSMPANSPSVLILAGGILALIVSMGSAFGVDYLNPSFRTPDEVIRYLEVPVLAALPKNGGSSRLTLVGNIRGWSLGAHSPGSDGHRDFPEQSENNR
ncbi:MAG TPA: Wzz/FepE/Etk N-terminal domain-containing protein [Terriglobia bacterium]|nr:Wzz/FepE/Etk N-terminal domain-containing protein [Terriglobia bacterium]